MNAAAENYCKTILNTHIVRDPKVEENCASRFGTTLNILILTPPAARGENLIKQDLLYLITLIYVSKVKV